MVDAGWLNEVSFLWLSWKALEWLFDLNTLGLSFGADFLVLLDALEEFIAAVGVADVFSADVDTLWSNVVVDALVNKNTNGTWGNVPDNTVSAVVTAVWHTTVDGTVDGDFNTIAKAESTEFLGWSWHTVLTEFASKAIASTPTKAFCVTHYIFRKRG